MDKNITQRTYIDKKLKINGLCITTCCNTKFLSNFHKYSLYEQSHFTLECQPQQPAEMVVMGANVTLELQHTALWTQALQMSTQTNLLWI